MSERLKLREAAAVLLDERDEARRLRRQVRAHHIVRPAHLHQVLEEALDLLDVLLSEPRRTGVPRLHERRRRLVEQIRLVRQVASTFDGYPHP